MRRGIVGLMACWVAGCGVALALDDGASRSGRDPLATRFDLAAPAVGDRVPDLTLIDAKGRVHRLRDLAGEHYTVLVLGCLT